MPAALLTLAALGVGLAAAESWREQRRTGQIRRAMLDPCIDVFDRTGVTKRFAPDGFPRLSGTVERRRLHVSLVPDTLTLKRLPQLWLVVGMPCSLGPARLAVTARPRGDDFVSRAADMPRSFRVPDWLPEDCAVRGDHDAAGLLARLRGALEGAFADPRLKEVAIEEDAMRLVYQACEGQRGAHLLLRQARFETPVDTAALPRCWSILREVEAAATPLTRLQAA